MLGMCQQTVQFIGLVSDAEYKTNKLKELAIFEQILLDRLAFYKSLNGVAAQLEYEQEMRQTVGMAQQLMQFAGSTTDEAYKNRLLKGLE